MPGRSLLLVALLVGTCSSLARAADPAAAPAGPRKIVIVAGVKSHGPEGNRIHDYPWTARLLKASLEASNVRDLIRVAYVRDGWPKDPALLADADALVVVSDGRDGDKYSEAPHLESPERVAEVQKLIDRGCGLCLIHFSTFAPDRYSAPALDWTGGHFDWEENGERKWYSAIRTLETDVVPAGPHPALAGVRPFRTKEEFYFNIRFMPEAGGAETESRIRSDASMKSPFGGTTTALLRVPALEGRNGWGTTVAWARERKEGGRGFGTTCGHFYDNWKHDDFRKLVLNALVWSAHAEVPKEGVDGPFLSRAAVMQAIGEPFDPRAAGEDANGTVILPEKKTTFAPVASPAVAPTGLASASPGSSFRLVSQKKEVSQPTPPDAPIRVLMFAGNEAHKWHNWEKTTPLIKKLLEIDPRITVDVSNNIEDLATRLAPGPDGKRPYDVIVQNYVNWHDNTPLSAASKSAFVDFIDGGGGLILVHFANGAWHYSLPMAGGSDWPEYRKIVRRVWNHEGPESKRSAHDPFKLISARPTKVKHEITKGLASFKLTDELYFSQAGDEPIEPLITAKSAITKKEEPLAWAYEYGQGRVFQTLLGHSEQTYDAFEPREMLRRAVAWAAKREVRSTPVDQDTSVPKKKVNHWGTDQVGFEWTERDSEDDRWKNSDIGNFLACIVPFGKDGKEPAEKGLNIKVGDRNDGAVCYDTGRGQMRAAWTGGFMKFHPRRYGIIEAPRPDGDPIFISNRHAGFVGPDGKPADFHYRGLWRTGDRTVLNWKVGETMVLEEPGLEMIDGQALFTRTFVIDAGPQPVVISLFEGGRNFGASKVENVDVVSTKSGDPLPAFAIQSQPGVALRPSDDFSSVRLEIAERAVPVEVIVSIAAVSGAEASARISALLNKAEVQHLSYEERSAQWTQPIVTKGVIGKSEGAFAVDTVTIPFENPYQAMFFVTGHDFLTPDVAALCTVHGDVWLVSGLAGDWSELKWKRFATGLFQPLGLVVRKRLSPRPKEAENAESSLTSPFDILVLCRDHIARLHDLNADDEADYYEVFNEEVTTSAGGHDYVTCLEQDNIGRLYYIHALEGIVRVSPDGRYKEILATGYRNPNGLGVGPDGEVTIAPQEGTWTPSSGIFEARPGGYGGFGGPKVQSGRPLGYDPPLCWIPRRLDNSSGGQVWVTSDKWGPLEGKMLHLSYGQCTSHLVLREEIHGVGQGGTIKLPPTFESGVCRGRFNPFDGQLYVSGLRGWTTSATQDGCLQRMRYTGKPVHLPTGVGTLKNGLMLTFSDPLDRDSAEDPDNYFAEQWNITYRQEYGSPEFKISNPKEEGRDPVDIESATLMEDGRTVFLEIPTIQPVSQLSLSYTLTAKDGTKLDQTYVHTIHLVRDAPFDPAKITRRAPKGQLAADEEKNLKPGFGWEFATGSGSDRKPLSKRSSRLAALHAPAGQFPMSALLVPRTAAAPVNEITANGTGFLFVPLKTAARLQIVGTGLASLEVNGQELIPQSALAGSPQAEVALHKGYNRIRLAWLPSAEAGGTVRLLWSTDGHAFESLPPEALFHADAEETWWDDMVRKPRIAIDALHCRKCHTGIDPAVIPLREAPSLVHAGSRFREDWLAAWILDPRAHRKDATMPALLGGFEQKADREQAARDVAAFLAGLSPTAHGAESPKAEATSHHRGNALFEDLGCIVCHRLTPNSEVDPWNRQSLTEVASKFRPGQLQKFIQQPHEHFPTSYMPNFGLTDQEAEALAGFLISKSQSMSAMNTAPRGDAVRGRQLFGSLGCRQCHTAESGDQLGTERIALREEAGGVVAHLPVRGCLADDPADWRNRTSPLPIPDFGLTEDQSRRIATVWCQKELPSPADASKRLMKAMHCQACHDRDGVKSARMQIIAEESESGFVPEALPALTWTGERLQTRWMEDFIAGRLKAKPREWLKARMPAFPAYAEAIAHGIAAEHGLEPTRAESRAIDAELAAAGRELIGSTGLDCRQCHALGDAPPTGDKNTLLAPGINFSLVKNRVQSDFYHRWMLDPPRYDTNTRMPKLAPDGRTTKVTKFFDGDARKQFAAIWEYLQSP